MYSDGHAPIAYIDWLAVRRAIQGQRVGTLLLVDALRRAHVVAQHIPIYGVALRSLNERTTRLYERHGFVVREEAPHPLMIIPIWTINDLFSPAPAQADSVEVDPPSVSAERSFWHRLVTGRWRR